jgi:tetratricopeptide (TPR) repeat protein
MNQVGLPLRVRLKRAVLIALILGLWAPFKILWEQEIGHEQDSLRYHGVTMTRQLRDELGQGLTIGVLSGMRNIVADLMWLDVTLAWETQDWFKMGAYVNLCTALKPRSTTFWEVGGWQLAWNASVSAMEDPREPNELRRIKASRFWIQKGLDVYQRGIENNPESWRLWAATAHLYYQRLADNENRAGQRDQAVQDYLNAAHYYQQASLRPNCPVYYERFPAYMYEKAGDEQDAYASWKALWERLTPAEREQPIHFKKNIEDGIRKAEEKLSIPKEKRIFPN